MWNSPCGGLIGAFFQLFSRIEGISVDFPVFDSLTFFHHTFLMGDDFRSFGATLAMPGRGDGYSAHIAPRADYELPTMMLRLKILACILRILNWIHVALAAVGLLGFSYLVIYYYLIQVVNFPKDTIYEKISELHLQVLHHPIGDRDVAYLVLFLFLFIADNVVLRACKCMSKAEDHSLAVIGAFVACVPLLSTFSIPFGCVALFLLLKPAVEKKFR
jgi:hypothetical protein